MSLFRMTVRRVEKLIAWILAALILGLVGAGAFYVVWVI